MDHNVSRRSFIAGGAAAMALATGAALSGCAEPKQSGGKQATAETGGHAWERPADEIDPADIVETLDCEVLVVGAGIAGVTAAHAAAEAGASTILIEKNSEFSARGHDLGVVNAQVQKDAGLEFDKTLMRRYYSQITCNKTNIGQFNVWLDHSGEVADHYIEKIVRDGLPINAGSAYSADEAAVNPLTFEFPVSLTVGSMFTEDGEWANHVFVHALEGYAIDEGVDIHYNTRAVQLLRPDNGRVTGCIAETDAGLIQINAANGVILATGGITQNQEMLEMWARPAAGTDQILYTPIDGNTGDGLVMSLQIGAARQKTNQATMALPGVSALGGQLPTEGYGTTWMVANLLGQRYVAEDSLGSNISHATLNQPEGQGWSIYDGNWATYISAMTPSGVDMSGVPVAGPEREAAIEKDVAEGKVMFCADTIEELAEKVGMPPEALAKQVEEWNQYVANGADEQYGMDPEKMYPIDTPPYYASRIKSGVLVVIYGPNCNEKAQVCNELDEPIEGLYAIGNTLGNFYTDSYPILFPGISHGNAFTFGHLVGSALAKGKNILE